MALERICLGGVAPSAAHDIPVLHNTTRTANSDEVDTFCALCTRAIRYLRASDRVGRVVNIASMAAHLGFTDVVLYRTSTSAVGGLTRGLAHEFQASVVLGE